MRFRLPSVILPSSISLVTKAMAGDKQALSTLLQRYRPVVMRHLQRYPVDDADRKDLLQEAMLQVVRKLHTFRGDAQFSTWLYRVTANAALSPGQARAYQVLVASLGFRTIADYQRAAHLPATGQIDEATRHLLLTPVAAPVHPS